jgi:two-component system response regulator MprA
MDGPSSRSKLLLIVDDDARTARMLARMLREDGYLVEVASDGAAALARLTRAPIPDLVITDLSMPYADGGAVARYAQSLRPRPPIFLVTGYPEMVSGLEHSLDPPPHLFTKPLDYDTLTTALARTIGAPGS